MAFLEKKIGRNSYYYEVHSYRENGKVKQKILGYFGRTDPRKNPNAKPISKRRTEATYRFGDVALLYNAAQEIGLIDIVNRYVPKRQGLSLGLELFLTVAHRLLDNKPSSLNLSRWVKTTHLPALLDFDANRLTSDTQDYMMSKIHNEEMNINHLLRISKDLYTASLPLFGKEDNIFFYDVTSSYFEGTSCPIAKFGYNRDGKIDKLQINIGMVVNGKYGIPLMSKVFEGNISDALTVYEMVYYSRFTFGKKKGLLIMDRGMDSEENIRIMDTVHYDYIIGLRANHAFVDKLRDKTDPTTDDWEIFESGENKIKAKKFCKNIFGKRRSVILYYNPAIAQQKKQNRLRKIENAGKSLGEAKNLNVEKAKIIVNGLAKYFVFEKKNGKITWRIDNVEVNRAERRDGKFCLITNLDIAPVEVLKMYFSKDMIEKAFRYMKQDGNLHPTRKRLTDHVIADVFICHIAYLLLKVAEHLVQQKKIDIFWDGLTSEAGEIRVLEQLDRSGNKHFEIVSNNAIQKNIVEKLELSKQLPVSTTNQK
jgi:transposase